MSDARLVVLAAPSEHLRSVASRIAAGVREDAVVVVATKGIEETTHALMTDVVRETLPRVSPGRRC